MIKTYLNTLRDRIFGFNPKTLSNLDYNFRRYVLEQNILHLTESGISNTKYCNSDIIVSLTSYGKRIYDVALTIESIMEQTMKANKIILWLDYSFEKKELPYTLTILKKRGLEINYCEDILSYKKIIPTLKTYPNDVIITFDDDILYDFDVIERLMISYLNTPNFIHCLRHHKMKFDSKHTDLLPYVQWDIEAKNEDLTFLNFFTSGAGTLFPPHSLDSNVTDSDTFFKICKYADDVWLNAMAILKGTYSKQCYTRTINSIEGVLNYNVQDIALANKNFKAGGNDIYIKEVFNKYNIYALLK
jgi:hypothetical protein